MARRQIINGGWQSPLGEPLSGGCVTFRLTTDCTASSVQISAEQVVTVYLDAFGSVLGNIEMWPNDQLTPSDTYYVIHVYTQQGELAWSGQQTITSGAGPFDLNSWIAGE